MSLDEYRGGVWAWRELMLNAQRAIDAGELKPARVIWRFANPAKVLIGRFAARILRAKRTA